MAKPTVINDRYELEPLPAVRGGMGEVWFGHDRKLDRPVAIKFVTFPKGVPDDQLTRRFVRESRIAARITHPGVPAVYDVGVHDGRPYLVMQRIDGITVADLIAEQGRLPVGWAAVIAAQTCAVLATAHAASLIHRDLKPRNLMLEPDGGVKVLDFGLAVAVGLSDFSKITRTGEILGTPDYMAPEQLMAGSSSTASDLYALGCTLHEMLCGQPVFEAPTTYALMRKQVDEPPPAVRSIRPEVPTDLDDLVLELLRKRPEDRPPDAVTVYERLLAFAVDLRPIPGVLQPPSAPSPARMYAAALSRVYPPAPRKPAVRSEDAVRISCDKSSISPDSAIAVACDEADRLRQEHAETWFETGDYHRAASEYRRLAEALIGRQGADPGKVLTFRVREATCHALLGQTSRALRQLQQLLDDRQTVLGTDDPGVLDLRHQIELLQFATDRPAG